MCQNYLLQSQLQFMMSVYQINEIFPVFDAENTGGQGNPAPTI